MANVAKSNDVAVGFGLFRVIDNLFSKLSESYSNSRKFQATYNELNALSTRDLSDLGISRSDITRIAYGSVYGDENDEFQR